jgi:hypothetical protein
MKRVVQVVQIVQVQARGRPRCGSWHLQTMLPARVLDALVKVENETNVYRTRVAAHILCQWASRPDDVTATAKSIALQRLNL